jgi:hypothetical protein
MGLDSIKHLNRNSNTMILHIKYNGIKESEPVNIDWTGLEHMTDAIFGCLLEKTRLPGYSHVLGIILNGCCKLIKNNYLTLRLKVKVPRRSLRYVPHSLCQKHFDKLAQKYFRRIFSIWLSKFYAIFTSHLCGTLTFDLKVKYLFFLAHLVKGHVSFCHQVLSIVCRKFSHFCS